MIRFALYLLGTGLSTVFGDDGDSTVFLATHGKRDAVGGSSSVVQVGGTDGDARKSGADGPDPDPGGGADVPEPENPLDIDQQFTDIHAVGSGGQPGSRTDGVEGGPGGDGTGGDGTGSRTGGSPGGSGIGAPGQRSQGIDQSFIPVGAGEDPTKKAASRGASTSTSFLAALATPDQGSSDGGQSGHAASQGEGSAGQSGFAGDAKMVL